MILDDPWIVDALERAARRNQTGTAALRSAIEHESAGELMRVLRLTREEAELRMEHFERVLAFGGDWGAGCRLLSDDLRDELLALLDAW